MSIDRLAHNAAATPWPAALLAVAALAITAALIWASARALRRIHFPPGSVMVAAAAAAGCTAYSADTSWGFARDWLGMHSARERVGMFAAAEVALLACAIMARANKQATANGDSAGTPGVPGVLVWVVTGVQVIPAYAESGPVGGTVRAIVGPVLAGLLWHLAMGLEIRVARPAALSTGLAALIGRELRERLLSYLGLATRDRTAEQISRDRAMARAVRLASRPNLRGWGRRRLAAAVARARVGTDGEQRHRLLRELSARRGAAELSEVALPSPWDTEVLRANRAVTPEPIEGAFVLDEAADFNATSEQALRAARSEARTDAAITALLHTVGAEKRKPPRVQPPSHPAGPVGSPVEDVQALYGSAHAPVVYFLRNGNRIKIGTSQNLKRRIAALSLRLDDVVLVEHGHQEHERALHRRFDDLRVGDTEWFALAGALAEHLGLDAEPDTADTRPDTDPAVSGRPDTEPDNVSGHPDNEGSAPAVTSPDTRPDTCDPLSELAKAAAGPSDLVRSLAAHGVPMDDLVSEAVRLRPDMVADSIRRTAKRLGEGPYL